MHTNAPQCQHTHTHTHLRSLWLIYSSPIIPVVTLRIPTVHDAWLWRKCAYCSRWTHTQYRWHSIYSTTYLLFTCTILYITTKKRHLRLKKKKKKKGSFYQKAWWNEPEPLRVLCYLYLLHVFEMYGVDNSSNLNVMQNTLWNGSGCINTISCESYPPGTVNVLILQSLCHDKTISWIPMRFLY